MSDVWDQAEQARTAGTQRPDRAAEQRALDPNADPFGTPDSVGGGGGIRGPKWDDMVGRLIVLKPVEKLLNQPVPNQADKTQDFWSCDLTVLDGGPITVVTPAREAQGDLPALPEVSNTYETPFTFPRWYARATAVTGKLDKLELPLYLGVVRQCPTGPEYRAGKTWQDKERQLQEWADAARRDPMKAGNKPQFSWQLVDPTPEQRAVALKWWADGGA